MSERKAVLRCFATLALLLFALVPVAAGAQRAELEKIIERKVLENGLEIIVVENHGVPLATIEIEVKNGAFTQSPEYEGLAHMYEHMFFRANARYPETGQFSEAMSNLGAQYNAVTQEENVGYYMTVPSDKLGEAIATFASALLHPLFRTDELERERQVVIGEYDRHESSPFFALERRMNAELFPENFSRKDMIGDRKIVLTTTPEKMRTIQKKYYIPNNSVLVVSGDVNPGTVFSLAERELGQWSRGAGSVVHGPNPPVPPPPKKGRH